MKIKHLLFACIGALALHACSSDEEILNTSNEVAGEVVATSVNLVVPVGCREIRVDYPTASGIESLTANISPVAKVTPGRDVSPFTNTTVNIVSPVDTYVNVYDEDGNPLVENYPILATSSRVVQVPAGTITLPEDAVKEYVTSDGPFTFYHSSGVVMFDDSWPNSYTNDGDFNDVVIDYDIEAKTVDMNVAPNQSWRECIKVVMHLRAVGGGYPKFAGLALEGLDTKYIDSYECTMTIGNWNTNLPGGKRINGNVDMTGTNPVITFDGFNWLITTGPLTAEYVNSKTGQTQKLNPTDGQSRFYNVCPGFINTGGDLFTLTVIFRGKDRSTISKEEGDAMISNFINSVMDTESQNFYIGVTNDFIDVREIHMKGYKPTAAYTKYDEHVASASLTMDASTTYSEKNGYVWGFKTPVMTRHAWEKISFYKAYPEYTAWVTSKGATNANWYKNPDVTKICDWW